MKIMYIVTTPQTARGSLKGQLKYVQCEGKHEVQLISSPGADLDFVAETEGVRVYPIAMAREISIFRDLISLVRICWTMLMARPDVVVSGTPKAGLLGTVSAFLTRVPRRIYLLKGLRLDTTTGTKRRILTFMEKLASGCATEVICVSQSLKNRYVSLGLTKAAKAHVLGNGTSNGMDPTRFNASVFNFDRQMKLRDEYGIPQDAQVLGFVGRLVADKGIGELLACFRWINPHLANVHLILVGSHEAGDGITEAERDYIRQHPQIHEVGFRSDVESLYALMDVFLFPSRREGFPKAPLEAGLMQVPSVAFNVVGSVDAIQDDFTGFVVPAGDQQAFNARTIQYLQNDDLRRKHGEAAEAWVKRSFDRENVWQQYVDHFEAKPTLAPLTEPNPAKA